MKRSGLSNRFSSETRHEWLYFYSCMVCGMNGIDALHHIVSPSSRFYVKGEHNESVLNSCPIHNQVCHVGNEAFLYSEETIRMLLKKTLDALTSMGYTLKPIDREFLRVYANLYG